MRKHTYTRDALNMAPFLVYRAEAVAAQMDPSLIVLVHPGFASRSYPITAAGLAAAIAAAVSGDAILIPPCTITGNFTIPENVTVLCDETVIVGSITVAPQVYILGMVLSYTVTDSDPAYGLIGQATGTARFVHGSLLVTNAGTGAAVAVQAAAGALEIIDSHINGHAASGDGIGVEGSTGSVVILNTRIEGLSDSGSGYGIRERAGAISMYGATLQGTTSPAIKSVSPIYAPGAQVSTGAITVTSSTGMTISGLTPGNWYCVEGFNGPWNTGEGGIEYTFQLSNGGAFSGDVGYSGAGGQFYLISPSFCAFSEAIDSQYGRTYFQATTTSILVRVADNSFPDNTGTMSWRLRDATCTTLLPATIHVGGVSMTTVVGEPLLGDRSAWNTETYSALHADLIDDPDGIHWTKTALDAAYGGATFMEKSTYDINDNGVVDNAEALDGHAASYFSIVGHTHAAGDLTSHWEPMTNGDLTTPEIVFADGDVVMVEVLG